MQGTPSKKQSFSQDRALPENHEEVDRKTVSKPPL